MRGSYRFDRLRQSVFDAYAHTEYVIKWMNICAFPISKRRNVWEKRVLIIFKDSIEFTYHDFPNIV